MGNKKLVDAVGACAPDNYPDLKAMYKAGGSNTEVCYLKNGLVVSITDDGEKLKKSCRNTIADCRLHKPY